MGEPKSGVVVGYALREKRIKSLLTPELLQRAKEENVEFVKIDPDRPIADQGDFDLLLHKLEGEEWERKLEEYEAAHPETVIVDKYANVHLLDDRLEMLKVVSGVDEALGVDVAAPKQLFIPMGTTPEDIPKVVAESGLQLPFVSKPAAANGTTNAHQLCLVLTENALQHLEPPLVLQEFVNHGGILFKLYVLGEKVMVFKRQSLPDIPKKAVDELKVAEAAGRDLAKEANSGEPSIEKSDSIGDMVKKGAGLVEFNRISNVHMSEEEMNDGRVVDPPPDLMQKLGLELRKRTGLQTFNVDILREEGRNDRYFIVDINYMPGYERLPDYENMFLGFLRAMVEKRRMKLQLSEEERIARKQNAAAKPQPPLPATPYPPLPPKKRWVRVSAAFRLGAFGRSGSNPDGPEKITVQDVAESATAS